MHSAKTLPEGDVAWRTTAPVDGTARAAMAHTMRTGRRANGLLMIATPSLQLSLRGEFPTRIGSPCPMSTTASPASPQPFGRHALTVRAVALGAVTKPAVHRRLTPALHGWGAPLWAEDVAVGTLDERYSRHLTSALELQALTVGDMVHPDPRRAVSHRMPTAR
jgi:hypothetical protein